MAALGDILREAREARGISLFEAERDTKIRAKYLAALEDDNLTLLPGPVYARGFLRNYASYLGVEPEEAVDLFDKQIQPTRTKIRAARGEPAEKKTNKPYTEKISIQPLSPQPVDTRVRYGSSYIAVSLLALPLIFLFYFIYSAWGVNRSGSVPIPTPRPPTLTPLSLPTQLAVNPGTGAFNTPTVAVALPPQSGIPALSLTPTVVVPITPTVQYTNVTVKINTTDDAWLQVTIDGTVQYSGTLKKGSAKQWVGNKTVRIRSGRADAVHVVVNGVDKGTMQVGNTRIITKEWDISGTEKVVP